MFCGLVHLESGQPVPGRCVARQDRAAGFLKAEAPHGVTSDRFIESVSPLGRVRANPLPPFPRLVFPRAAYCATSRPSRSRPPRSRSRRCPTGAGRSIARSLEAPLVRSLLTGSSTSVSLSEPLTSKPSRRFAVAWFVCNVFPVDPSAIRRSPRRCSPCSCCLEACSARRPEEVEPTRGRSVLAGHVARQEVLARSVEGEPGGPIARRLVLVEGVRVGVAERRTRTVRSRAGVPSKRVLRGTSNQVEPVAAIPDTAVPRKLVP